MSIKVILSVLLAVCFLIGCVSGTECQGYSDENSVEGLIEIDIVIDPTFEKRIDDLAAWLEELLDYLNPEQKLLGD